MDVLFGQRLALASASKRGFDLIGLGLYQQRLKDPLDYIIGKVLCQVT